MPRGASDTRPRRRPGRCAGPRPEPPKANSEPFGSALRATATTWPRRRGARFLRSPASCELAGHEARRASHGSTRLPAGKSTWPGAYRKDGSSVRAATSPGFTSCGFLDADPRRFSGGGVDPRERAVRGSEIDAHDEAFRHANHRLLDFDFRRGNDAAAGRWQWRQVEPRRFPAAMLQHAAEGRGPSGIAYHFHPRRIGA